MALTKITGRGIGSVILSSDTASGDDANIGFTAAEGLILTGQGSTNDVTIKNDADANVIQVPTGTTNVTIGGNLSVGGDLDVTGNMDMSDANLTNVGTIALDSLSGDGDANTTIAFSGSDVITFTTGGTAAATINASQLFTANAGVASTTGNFSGIVTANAGVVVDEMTIDGDTITATDDFIIDAVGDIILDADDAQVIFKDAGTTIGGFNNSSSNLNIFAHVQDKDITFTGDDGGLTITALTLDMSAAGAAIFNSSVTATSLDISGNVDIDGTTNLDAVDIDGAVQIDNTVTVGENDTGYDVKFFGDAASAYMLWDASADDLILGGAGGLVVAGTATFNGALNGTLATAAQTNITSLGALTSLTVDDITINGSTISDAGNFTIDAGGDISLDADGADILFKDDGTTFGSIINSSSDFQLNANVQDKDIKFTGNDGGSGITALTLDMSDGGVAFFGNDIRLEDNRAARFGNDQDFRIYNDGSASYLVNSTLNHDMLFVGNDDGSSITALTLDMSNAGKATFTGIVNSAMGFERGDMFITANEIDVSSGDLTLDVAGDITLDADGGEIRFKDGGSSIMHFSNSSSDAVFQVNTADKDFIVKGDDGGSIVTALTLDMSDAGRAIFNSDIGVGVTPDTFSSGYTALQINGFAYNIGHSGGDHYITNNAYHNSGWKYGQTGTAQMVELSSGQIQFKTVNSGSADSAITWIRSMQVLDGGGIVVNEDSADIDFRVESNGSQKMLFVDGGNNGVLIDSANSDLRPYTTLDVTGQSNTEMMIHNDTDGVGEHAALLFKADSQNESGGARSRTKAGIFFVRDDPGTRGTGKLHIAVDGGNDDTNVAPGDAAISITANGEVTMPKTPSFSVTPSGAQNNFSANSHITVVFATEVFDVGSNFASNTFTAPVTGKYQLNMKLDLQNIDTAADYYQYRITTSNRIYAVTFDPDFGDSDTVYHGVNLSVLADMDASDTAIVTIYQSGGTAQSDLGTGSAFNGILVG